MSRSFDSPGAFAALGAPDAARRTARLGATGLVAAALAASLLTPLPAWARGDVPFQACGRLAPGPQGCPALFSEGEFYFIENVGDGFYGQWVFVEGTLTSDVMLCAPFPPSPSIIDNTVEPCFRACGSLVQSSGCLVFFDEDDGQLYRLDDTGDFGFGDRVFVTGRLNETCDRGPCSALPCVESNSIASCVSGCGAIIQAEGCTVFALDAGGVFQLDDLGAFAPGDRVCVAGGLDAEREAPCGVGCVRANFIEGAFSDCGRLGGVTQGCVLFQTGAGDLVALENAAGMTQADDVYVSGRFDPKSFFCFPFIGPGVTDNVIGPCFAECGTLVQGAECAELETDGGSRYLVSNRGAFQVGDRVRVEGMLDEGCITICLGVQGCVLANTISAPVLADLTCDGEINVDDLVGLILAWGPCPSAGGICPGDVNSDGVVDVNDLVGLLMSWTG